MGGWVVDGWVAMSARTFCGDANWNLGVPLAEVGQDGAVRTHVGTHLERFFRGAVSLRNGLHRQQRWY